MNVTSRWTASGFVAIEWRDLAGSIQQNLKKLLAKRLDNPHVLGGELHGALSRCYKIKLNKQGVRLVYDVEDDKLIVMVLSVDRRKDNAAYKSAVDRLSADARALSKAESTKPVGPVPLPSGKK